MGCTSTATKDLKTTGGSIYFLICFPVPSAFTPSTKDDLLAYTTGESLPGAF